MCSSFVEIKFHLRGAYSILSRIFLLVFYASNAFSGFKLSVTVEKNIGITMECRVDGRVFSRLEELIEHLPWPNGDPILIQLAMGDATNNPIIRWDQDLASAQSLLKAGRYGQAIDFLSSMLQQMEGMSGTAVAEYMPKTLGSLGTAYYRAGATRHRPWNTHAGPEICVKRPAIWKGLECMRRTCC